MRALPGHPRAHRPRGPDRPPGPKEIQARLTFLARRRPRIPEPRPRLRHPVRRRSPAHPAGHPDRLRPGGRALRPRRALHRPAPAGQPPADRDADPAARPGQHPDRGRARRGHHPGSRLGGGHRTRRRRPRRPGGRTPAPTRTCWQHRRRSPATTSPAASRSTSRRSGASTTRSASSRSSGAKREQPARTSTPPSRWASSPRSPASAARASPPWSTRSSTRCSPTSSTAPSRSPARHTAVQGLEHLDKVITRRPEPHRPHAALQPGHLHRRLRPHPQALRRDHRGEGPRLPAGPLLASTSRAAAARRAQGDGTLKIEMHFLPDV